MSKSKNFVKCQSCLNDFNFHYESKRAFCSIKCQMIKKKTDLITRWYEGTETGMSTNGTAKRWLRNFLLEINNFNCSICSFEGYNIVTGNSILEIDHIDGDTGNNHFTNIRVVCPNCHAMTPTFRALNKKSKRNRSR